jgi:hypothetical protein
LTAAAIPPGIAQGLININRLHVTR